MKRILKLLALFSLFSQLGFSADHVESKNPEVEAIETMDINWGKCTETVFGLAHHFVQVSLDQEKIFPVKYDKNCRKIRKCNFHIVSYRIPKKIKGNKKQEKEFIYLLRKVLRENFVGPCNRAIILQEYRRLTKPKKKKDKTLGSVGLRNRRHDGMAF